MAVTAVLVGTSNLLMYCYLSKLATDSYAKMSDCVYNKITWYELPIGLQKYFVLMIQNMQQPLNYHGFGVIYLNLETFTKVSEAFSFDLNPNYFMSKHNMLNFLCSWSSQHYRTTWQSKLWHWHPNNYGGQKKKYSALQTYIIVIIIPHRLVDSNLTRNRRLDWCIKVFFPSDHFLSPAGSANVKCCANTLHRFCLLNTRAHFYFFWVQYS